MCIDHHMPKPEDHDIGNVDFEIAVAADVDEDVEQDLHLHRVNPQLVEGKQLRRKVIRAYFEQAVYTFSPELCHLIALKW